MTELIKWILLKMIYPAFYRLAALRPVRKKAVFVEVRGHELSDSFVLLVEKLREKKDTEVRICYLDNLRGGRLALIRGTLAMLWTIGDARAVFVNDTANFMGAFRLRKESRMIQVWHACGAFKKWGCSIADRAYGSSRAELQRYPSHRNYTLVPVSGEAVRFAYAEAFGFPENCDRVQALGVSRTDIFYRPEFRAEARRKLREIWPEWKGQKIVLYAPTFRGQARSAVSPVVFTEEELSGGTDSEVRRVVLHPELWKRTLGENRVLLVKQHPFVRQRPEIPAEFRDFARDVTEKMTIEELLVLADCCVTDYSSLIFEYSLMERPMVFWAFDRSSYEDWRGFYFPYEELVPGPIAETERDVLRGILRADEQDPEQVRSFRRRFMGACDGHATERILAKAMEEKA